MADFDLKPLTSPFGREVTNIDLATVDDPQRDALATCLMEHKVLIFRNQQLSPDEYARFGRRWTGATRVDGFTEMNLPGFDDINIVGNVGKLLASEDYRNGAAFWHTDCAAEPDANATTMLYCIHALEQGGETRFADMELAYATLDDTTKQQIENLIGLHCYAGARPILGDREDWEFALTPVTDETAGRLPPPAARGVVRNHSVTGRKGLYSPAGSMFEIEGMQNQSASALMHRLKQHATQPQFGYAHHYRPGDVVMWDNSSTLHCAAATQAAQHSDDRRLMYRICPTGLPVSMQG
jgi:taurine dioxygenase